MEEKSTFYILNQAFETMALVDQYESIMWIDRYYTPGEVEIHIPPVGDAYAYAKVDNYIWCSDSDHLMIIESTELTFTPEDGAMCVIKGRSLESILDRRILLYDTVFKENLEDGIRQILDVSFISPSDSSRKVSNLKFQYSGDSRISSVTTNNEFDKGTDLLEVITTILKGAKFGYEIKLVDGEFIFRVICGYDRSFEQEALPWVIFSPEYDNLMNGNFLTEAGADHKNFIYTEGEEYNNQAPEIVTTGTATGLLRREFYNDQSGISHEVDNVKLTAEEYTRQLTQSSNDVFNEKKIKNKMDTEVDYKVNFVYGIDYSIGDLVQVSDGYGHDTKSRVTEFIISHSESGVEMYPTFTGIDEEDEDS